MAADSSLPSCGRPRGYRSRPFSTLLRAAAFSVVATAKLPAILSRPTSTTQPVVQRRRPGIPGAPAQFQQPSFKETYAHARHRHTAWARRSAVLCPGDLAPIQLDAAAPSTSARPRPRSPSSPSPSMSTPSTSPRTLATTSSSTPAAAGTRATPSRPTAPPGAASPNSAEYNNYLLYKDLVAAADAPKSAAPEEVWRLLCRLHEHRRHRQAGRQAAAA